MSKPNFVWDKEKMKDFSKMKRDDFLNSYSYLTEEEYNTIEILNAPNMEEFVLKLSNSRVPYGLITVEYNPSGNSYTINIDGKVWSNYLSYYETRHDLTDLITGYELYDRKKRDDILKERKQYGDKFCKYLDAASPEIIAGYFLYDYGDDAYDRWMECADEFKPAERQIITNIISKLGKGE